MKTLLTLPPPMSSLGTCHSPSLLSGLGSRPFQGVEPQQGRAVTRFPCFSPASQEAREPFWCPQALVNRRNRALNGHRNHWYCASRGTLLPFCAGQIRPALRTGGRLCLGHLSPLPFPTHPLNGSAGLGDTRHWCGLVGRLSLAHRVGPLTPRSLLAFIGRILGEDPQGSRLDVQTVPREPLSRLRRHGGRAWDDSYGSALARYKLNRAMWVVLTTPHLQLSQAWRLSFTGRTAQLRRNGRSPLLSLARVPTVTDSGVKGYRVTAPALTLAKRRGGTNYGGTSVLVPKI